MLEEGNIITSPELLGDMGNYYKIGSSWIFNRITGEGYKVIKNKDGEVTGFLLEYTINNGVCKSRNPIPAGVLRKSQTIARSGD